MFSCCKKDNQSNKYEIQTLEDEQEQQQLQVQKELNNEIYKNLQKVEKQLLSTVGLEVGINLDIQNVFINKEKTQWIHTLICGDIKLLEDKEKLKKQIPYVMIHGYGHTGLCFFQTLKELSQERLVYCIDILGMGLSHRPDFEFQSPELILDFFNNGIEKWRQSLNIEKFILVGHSIGGYLSANYAMKYPQFIENLHLISPIGGTAGDDQENIEYEQFRVSNMSRSFKTLYKCIIKPGWQNQETTETLSQKWWFPTQYVLKKYVKNRCKLEGEQFEHYKNIMQNSFSLKASSTKCLHLLFRFPKLSPYISLEEQLPLKYKNKNVHFYFGDNDWMNQKGAKRIIDQKLVQGSLTIIKNAGHNIQFDNSKDLIQKIKENDQNQQIQIEKKEQNQNIL